MSQRVRGLLDRLLARRRVSAGDSVSDVELLRRYARERDEAAFELLVWRYGAMVLGLCRRSLRDEQRAEDAFQAVFLVLARKAGGVRGNLGGWLFKVARRVANRAAARQPVTHPVQDTAGEIPPDLLEQQELSDLLDAEVARLPARLRGPVVLCYLGGLTTEDAARELGCPRGTVLSRLAAARARLAARLTRRGVTLPAVLAPGGGTALTPRAVSATLAVARQFAAGSGQLSASISLAHGVIHAMNRTTLLTAFGAAALALALASGVGLVVAQNGPPKVGEGEASVPVAAPAPNAPPATKPDPGAAKRDADEHLAKWEQLAMKFALEIAAQEKALAVLERETNTEANALAELQTQHAEVERLLAAARRERDKLVAESKVLQALIDKKGAGAPIDPAALEKAIANDSAVKLAEFGLKEAKQQLEQRLANFAGEHPQVKAAQAALAREEKGVADARKVAAAKATEAARTAYTTKLRNRLDELSIQIAIKNEEIESLSNERNAIQMQIGKPVAPRARAEDLRRQLELQWEMYAKVQAQLLKLRAGRDGITLPDPTPVGTDVKLDAVLKELAALRKEVKELKAKK